MLYARFVICLAIGLFGICLFLKTLLDSLFNTWDAVAHVRALIRYRRLHARHDWDRARPRIPSRASIGAAPPRRERETVLAA